MRDAPPRDRVHEALYWAVFVRELSGSGEGDNHKTLKRQVAEIEDALRVWRGEAGLTCADQRERALALLHAAESTEDTGFAEAGPHLEHAIYHAALAGDSVLAAHCLDVYSEFTPGVVSRAREQASLPARRRRRP